MAKPERVPTIDRGAVLHVAGQVLAAHLAAVGDPATVDDSGLTTLADLSVRAALALEAAIPRAEQRLADEAAAKAAAEQAAADAERAPADKAAAEKGA